MIRKLLAVLALSVGLLAPAVVFSTSYAQFDPLKEPCENLTPAQRATSEACSESLQGQGEEPLVGNDGVLTTVTNILALVGGVIAVIIIVIAGITMTLSEGDSGKVSNSRNAVIYAVIGIIVIVIARSLVLFLINRIG